MAGKRDKGRKPTQPKRPKLKKETLKDLDLRKGSDEIRGGTTRYWAAKEYC